MSESSAALLELSTDDRLPTLAALGNINSPEQEALLGVAMQPMVLVKIFVGQSFSDESSVDKFIAGAIANVAGVKFISRERMGEKFRFYVVINDENPKTMDDVFEMEKAIYARFPEDDLEFEVLPGEELECVIPTGAVPLWRP